jgi:hypothetical protein
MTRACFLALALLAAPACGKRETRSAVEVLELQPTSGDPSGGKVVQIVGKNFDTHSTVEVKFGEKPARAIVVARDRIQLESPPGKAGEEAAVTVRFPDGQGGTLPQKYRWEPQDHAP